MRCLFTSTRSCLRGIALSDLLLAIAILSVLAGIGINVFPGVRDAADKTRLDKDVRTLNLAVNAYLNSGGRIPSDATPDAILAKLKSTATSAKTVAGLKGSMIDMRLKGRPIGGDAGGRRICWDHQTQSFRVAQAGAGWSEMTLDDGEAAVNHASEYRRTALPFASVEPWVWDYAEAFPGLRGPPNVPVSNPNVPQPLLDEPTFQLLPPAITPDAGEYGYRLFPMPAGIQNPNPAGTSRVRYQVDGSNWMTWNGTPLNLSRELTHSIQAFAEAMDGETWQQSPTVSANYVSYFIRGQADADFMNPAGESRLEQTISTDGRLFNWGRVQSAGQAHSALEFIPGAPFEAGPGESFTVATVRYTNGVSRAGTNATSVTAAISFPLTVPALTTVTVNLPVRMQNTVHYAWTPASDYQDYVWVPDTLPVTLPVVVLDRIYRLTLYTSAAGSIQDGTDLKIPVGESQSVDVTITAQLDPL